MSAVSPNLKEKLRRLPHLPGVYLMKDRLGQVLYVGKAKDLKKRVSNYFQPSRRLTASQPKVLSMLPLIRDVEVLEVRSEAEAILLEGCLIKQYRPRYNTDFTDDKRFLLVKVDPRETLPRFRLTRLRREDGARYFGPFARSGQLRTTLAHMRKQFGILLGDAQPVRAETGAEESWRLYDDVRAEIYGHPNRVTPAEYRIRLEAACAFLEGKSREWMDALETDMREAAEALDFERAAALRDALTALRNTTERTRKFTRHQPAPPTEDATVLAALAAHLGLAEPPRAIECFDISHVSGSYLVASLVRFLDGRPDKGQYRRFRIRSFTGNDDFRAMEEVVGRRYRRLAAEGQAFPGLVVIDGGKGQVGAALKAFLILDLPPPPLIGLAKKLETIHFPDNRPPLQLSPREPALRLLQRIRDEAHRFANGYNAELRSRRLRESILDEMPGLGPTRRKILLEHFGSLEKIRQAGPEELGQAPGIGPVFAARLQAFLHPPPVAPNPENPSPHGPA